MWIEIGTFDLKMPYITVRENKAKWWITVQGLNYNEVHLFLNIVNNYLLTARWDYYQRSSAISPSPTATRRRWLSSVSRHGWLVINSVVLCTLISQYGVCLFLLCQADAHRIDCFNVMLIDITYRSSMGWRGWATEWSPRAAWSPATGSTTPGTSSGRCTRLRKTSSTIAYHFLL